MAGTVTSQLTNVTLAESGDSGNWDDINSGPGSGQSTDSPIQGTDSRARRVDNTADKGMSYDSTTGSDISGTNVHVGVWVLVYQPAQLTSFHILLGDSATPKSGNWSGFLFSGADYPVVGGYIRVFVDPTQTRDVGAGTLNLSSNRQWGVQWTMGDVGGTALNCHIDRIDYTSGGLIIDAGTSGSPATFQDAIDADSGNSSNRYGVVIPRDGVIFCNARLTLGSSTDTYFEDENFSIVFADQKLCSDTFMGITCDLQNANTEIILRSFSVKSGGTTKLGDFVASSTAGGTVSCYQGTFDSLRSIVLNSSSYFERCSILNSGIVTGTTPYYLIDCTLSNATGITAIEWDIASDPNNYISGTSFISSNTGHGIILGTSAPTTITLTNVSFSNYASTDGSTGNEAIWVTRTTGTVTINVSGGDTPSIRTSGATVVVVNAVTVSVKCVDINGSAISGAAVFIQAASGGSLPYLASVSITRSGSTATVTHSAHGLKTNDYVVIRGANEIEYLGVHQITVIDANSYSYTVSGTPATPATGTITSTFVIINGTTDGSGNISNTGFAYTSTQPISGRARKSSSAPYYKTSVISGNITTNGYTQTVTMIED